MRQRISKVFDFIHMCMESYIELFEMKAMP